jgi:hypothetical protein
MYTKTNQSVRLSIYGFKAREINVTDKEIDFYRSRHKASCCHCDTVFRQFKALKEVVPG